MKRLRRVTLCGLALVLAAGLLVPTASVARQAGAERSLSSENFTVTWDEADVRNTADADGSGVPDRIERLLASFERARSALIALGYPSPSGNRRYPLFVGQSERRGFTHPYPGDSDSRRSFIVIPPRLTASDVGPAQVDAFAIHEFFHAVQLYLDYSERAWLKEASSSWVEDVVYDSADSNHTSLAFFVPFPHIGLASTGGDIEYGSFLFLQFLAERYGGGSEKGAALIHRWWQLMAVPGTIKGAGDLDSWAALDQLLAERGTTRPEAWAEFLRWRRQLRRFEEGAAYRAVPGLEGWPAVSRRDVVSSESCRLGPADPLEPMSGFYGALKPDPGAAPGTWRLSVDGPPDTTGFFLLKLRRVPVTTGFISTDGYGVAHISLDFDPAKVKKITVGLGDASADGGRQLLGYSLRAPDAAAVEASAPSGPSAITYGLSVLLTGRVLCGGEPAPWANVNLIERDVVSGVETSRPLVTDESGGWLFRTTPERNTVYRVEVVDPLISSVVSASKVVSVQVAVALEAPGAHPSADAPYSVQGTVTPVHVGAPVSIQIRRPGRDEWIEMTTTSVEANGTYAASFTFPADGTWEVRAVVVSTEDDDHEPGASGTKLVEVSP